MRLFTGLPRYVLLLIAATIITGAAGNQNKAHGADSTVVWSPDQKIARTLQPEIDFSGHAIQLPDGFVQSKADSFRDGSRTQWHGPSRPDGTRAVISISIQQLTAEQAAGDVTAYGIKLLEDSGSLGTTKYVAAKPVTGIDTLTGNWVTRFAGTCILKSPDGIQVPLRSFNYVWLDHGSLVMAIVYDADSHAKQSLPQMEASIWTVRSV